MLNKKKKGFTLIELIVVMAIIAILVLLAAPKYLNYTKDAHVTAMQQDAKVLSNIALGYNVKNDGVYPATAFADQAAFDAAVTTNKWTVTEDDLNDALVAVGQGATDVIAVTNLATFDQDKVSGSLQGLKNELTDYALVVNGTHEGEVVFLKNILVNSDGTKYVSVSPAIDQLFNGEAN